MHIKGTNVFQLDRWKGRLIDKASLIEAVRSNLAAVLLALCFLVGMVSGALITRNVDVSIVQMASAASAASAPKAIALSTSC